MSEESSLTVMRLYIGRPVLNGQWEHRNFPTRDIGWQEELRNAHYTVHTYPIPPIFDVQAARRLLSSINNTEVALYVSFLELDHQQCAQIVDGVTTLLTNLPEDMYIRFRLEYETDNVEHFDAVQQADVLADRSCCEFIKDPNHHIEAFSQMAVKGDNGHGRLV